MRAITWDNVFEWNETWALAVVFGLASVPWTYAFLRGLYLPLWPAFIASATFYAAGSGLSALVRGYASNTVGIVYAAGTLAVVETYLGGGVLALSLLVGAGMFLVSLNAFIPVLSFTPGGYFGYATMFSVHAAQETAFGVAGLPGQTTAALVSMLIGAVIGLATDEASTLLE